MPRIRWVVYHGVAYRLSHLAAAHGLAPGTLASRIDRGLPLDRALATGLVTREAAGRRSTVLSPWSVRSWPSSATGGPDRES